MAYPVITNIDGTNPGPASVSTASPQAPIGNIWKDGVFNVTLSPSSVAASTSAEQTFAATGIGLLTTDVVIVQKPTAQAGLVLGGSRVSAADTLAITFGNTTAATITPTAAQVYQVAVFRVQPNYLAPATGNQITW
jgi:hypothetical protein